VKGYDLAYYWRRAIFEGWDRLKPRYKVRTPGGWIVIPGQHRETANLARWRESWKTRMITRALSSRNGAFLDIGANLGQTLLDYCARNREVRYVAFEPNPQCVNLLNALVDINGLSCCTIVPSGLSDRNALLPLYLKRGSATDSGASTDIELRPGRDWDMQIVPCYRFDDIRDDLGLEAISFAKIDVEGAEGAVLKGMMNTMQRFRPWIACEVLHRDPAVSAEAHQRRIEDLREILASVDYTILRIEKLDGELEISGLTRLDDFSNKVWSTANAHECDYLFVPASDVDATSTIAGADVLKTARSRRGSDR
jgi:FkbM family methyltransferase